MSQSLRKHTALESLRRVALFSQVCDEDLESIVSHLIERRFPKHATIVEEGLPGDYMYLLLEGRVKVAKLSTDGREKILDFLESGDFFGEMALVDQAPRSASVKALTDVCLLALSRADFLELLRKNPEPALAVIQELSRRLRAVDEQASSLSFQGVRERAEGLLSRIANQERDDNRRATPPLTHQQIADMIGTSRETVTRVIKDLKRDGWLEQEGKVYLVSQ